MPLRLALLAIALGSLALQSSAVRGDDALHDELVQRLQRLEAQIAAAEDVRAIKRLQRAYGYYLDKGMWRDLAEFFTEDAVANYPAGTFIGKESIRKHLYLNVGNVPMGQVGLGDGRLYNHMTLQPVVHLDAGGETAQGRWRAFAMFGRFGGNATWAEGVYRITYAKEDGVWKIRTLDYHGGFGAPYQTGWVAPAANPAGANRPPRKLPHPPDRERNRECDGFAAACIPPFHYENPGRSLRGARVWPHDVQTSGTRRGSLRARAGLVLHRATLLQDEQQIENLQRIYGYYRDRAMWDHVADLFADDGTIELGLRGVYVGKARVRQFLDLLGPHGLKDGWLSDHLQLQTIVTVAPDGRTARARSRELGMTGRYLGQAQWSEGIYENAFVKEDGVWKLRAMRFWPTFITDYEQGWAKDAQPAPGVSAERPPDRRPTELYEIYPKAHVPPFHYRNPVTGAWPHYPEQGGPDRKVAAAMLMRAGRVHAPPARDVAAAIAEAERIIRRVRDFHELENLQSAYGYYLDKNLWNDLADLFAREGSMELAQRGVYRGREHVRAFLLKVFGRGGEGPVAGRLGNHIQLQPVITISADGQRAHIRSRMLQQMSFGERASLGAAIYENEAVWEDGMWKLQRVHAFNTFTASYEGGWAKRPNRGMPGPSVSFPPDAPPTVRFAMFPAVYDIPFHYANPVSGRTEVPPIAKDAELLVSDAQTSPGRGIPARIAAELREIGPRIDAQRTGALYAPLVPPEPYQNVLVQRDLAYGPHERHVLDVFAPPDVTPGKPVIVFVHGGGFTRGAKRSPSSPFYDNVMLWVRSQGWVGVNINYRLAPEHGFPSGIEDLTRVIAWINAHIAQYGGDPTKIFLWGHSAGAAHVADYIAERARAGADPGIAGAILSSGFYLGTEGGSIWKAYYGEDVSKYSERSSLPGLVKSDVPLLVNDAELDPEHFRIETAQLIEARARAGKPVRAVHLAGHSHLSETYAVGTGDESLSGPVQAFVTSLVTQGEKHR